MAYTDIDKPTDYFNTSLWTGNGTSTAIATGHATNLIWIKNRNDTQRHNLIDSVRGVTKRVSSNTTDAEATESNMLSSFDSNGFTLGSDSSSYGTNTSNKTYVGWSWKAGTAVSGNTTGSGSAKAYAGSVSTTAGFSIIRYLGNGTDGHTIPHHLGAAPRWIFTKRLDSSSAGDWTVLHMGMSGGASDFAEFNATGAKQTNIARWRNTAPSSTVFTIASNATVNADDSPYIAYCFAEKQGFSKFGSYKGNNNADGPFIYLGFKPAFLIMKETSGTGNWAIIDSTRSFHNVGNHTLASNLNHAESQFGGGESVGGDSNKIDLLSNGFKIREASAYNNGNGDDYIFMAFAESPFVTSTGVPATAR